MRFRLSMVFGLLGALILADTGRTDEEDPPSLDVVFIKNRTSQVDGSGLNVPTCVEMLSRRYRLTELEGFRDWTALERGGHWPQKLADQLERWCKLKEVDVPPYVQLWTKDIAFVEGMAKDRWVMVGDYGGKTTRYKGRAMAASLVIHLDKHSACLLDPNWREPEWITRADFEQRFGQWVFMFLTK